MEPSPPIADSIGGYTEAEISRLPTGERWFNPATNRVEPLSTSEYYRDAQRLATEARERFTEQRGFDRMQGEPEQQFDEFETAPSTPMRAGPGLAVSPMNVAAGVGAGLALVAGGAGVALADKRGDPSKFVVSTTTPTAPVVVPDQYPIPFTPSLLPIKDEVYGGFQTFAPLIGVPRPVVAGRRRRRRRRKSQFL